MGLDLSKIGMWTGLGGVSEPRGMPPSLLEGGYEKLFNDLWKPAIHGGCKEIWIKDPFGTTVGKGFSKNPDGTQGNPVRWSIVDLDAPLLAEADIQVPPIINVMDGSSSGPEISRRKYKEVIAEIKAESKGLTRVVSYVGTPWWSPGLRKMHVVGRSGNEQNARWNDSIQVYFDAGTDICVDALVTAPTGSLEYDWLKSLQKRVTRVNRRFLGEEIWACWADPRWKGISGLTAYSMLVNGKIHGRNVAQPKAYCFDDLDTGTKGKQALEDACQQMMDNGYIPLVWFNGLL